MKKISAFNIFSFTVICWVLCLASCKKETYITSSDAYLSLSEDTLHFDTVFTTLGSTTQFLKIFNGNDQKLRISKLELMGGNNSFFKLNVDGDTGTTFTNIDIEANDSIYLFATVRINPGASNLPFLVQDSVKIEYNGNTKWLQLDAYGKKAIFLRDSVIDKNISFDNTLPIVILGSLTVNPNVTLTIDKPNTQIYTHPTAPIIINGSLIVKGDTTSKVVFQGLRIDEPYKNYPGSWPGVYFTETSKDNSLEQCIIKNAYQGVIVNGVSSIPKLQLKECVFDNVYDVAILGVQSNIYAQNCLVSNVGYGFYAVSGGTYNFNHCTFASISNGYLSHKNALINLSNTNSDNTIFSALDAHFENSIIYGEGGIVDDEIVIAKLKDGTTLSATFDNVLYKQTTNNVQQFIFTNSLKNLNPLFVKTDASKREFDFTLQNNSPCIDAGKTSNVFIDLRGRLRPIGIPDIGCYEVK